MQNSFKAQMNIQHALIGLFAVGALIGLAALGFEFGLALRTGDWLSVGDTGVLIVLLSGVGMAFLMRSSSTSEGDE